MFASWWIAIAACASATALAQSSSGTWDDSTPLALPETGAHGLRILSPTVLELILVTTKEPDPARVKQWDFVSENFEANLPGPDQFTVTVNGSTAPVQRVGFKRRVAYAALRHRDLRIGNYLYLELGTPIADGQTASVTNPTGQLWSADQKFSALADPRRYSPALHVNQVGYLPSQIKKAMIGYYLGSLGELRIPRAAGFHLIDTATQAVVYQGPLALRADRGFTYSPLPYQQVFEADFSEFRKPGEYQLVVPGLGASYPFLIDEGAAAAFARTYALGLYHQRCGMENALPFTRFPHDACHTAPADVPTMQFHKTQTFLAEASADYSKQPRHTAPQLKSVDSSLFPFVKQGKINVSGGHHDAGDYSKYTINSAGLIHHLVFAADAFRGVGDLDNLGLPESGDGKSDLLQEARWEADFLAKMQDNDGGFYFLVYPKERRYEDNVLPHAGDPQVVWPKTTAVTAAATAALAEIGSSPRFKQQFPEDAARYLQQAELGWVFLERAIARHGKDGSYQKITHYGHEFMHDDELAWAAAALYAATGHSRYQTLLMEWLDPSDRKTRRWDWWRLFEGYGCAIRTYAFAARTGRLASNQINSDYAAKCEAEIQAAADDHVRFARDSAYGTSFPEPNKQYRSAGWYFSSERTFDIATAYQIHPRPDYLEALISNLNYEGGANPINVAHVTGLGWRRQREVVHHYAQNDHRVLPPTGLPLGNIQAGFMNTLYYYKGELSGLTYPSDWTPTAPYPMYDRWADAFNTSTEFVVMDQARCLGTTAFLMAQTELRTQPWRSGNAQIIGLPNQAPAQETVSLTLQADGIDLANARIVWEARDQQPYLGSTFRFAPKNPGEQWVEAEAQLPDGRRLVVTGNFVATTAVNVRPNSYQSAPITSTANVLAIFHLDQDGTDSTARAGSLQLHGRAALDPSNLGWMQNRAGAALSFRDLGDKAAVNLPSSLLAAEPDTTGLALEAMIYINRFKAYDRAPARILSLHDSWNAFLELSEDTYQGPEVRGGTQFRVRGAKLAQSLKTQQWHHISLTLDRTGYSFSIDGAVVERVASTELTNWGQSTTARLELGNFDGWIDEVVIKKFGRTTGGGAPSPAAIKPPVISPNGGVFNHPVPVALSAFTPGVSIRYTLDGSTPGPDSPEYSTPFTVPRTTVVRAKAFKPGVAESPETRATLVIDSSGSLVSRASFVNTDTTTRGNWKGQYGTEGFQVIGQTPSIPRSMELSVTGQSNYAWSDSTLDPRALQKPLANDRLAACWYAEDYFTFEIRLTDGQPHRLSFYLLDWDRTGRRQSIEIYDLATGQLLSQETVQDFQDGKYMTWEVEGQLRVVLRHLAGPNAVLMGWFLNASRATPAPGRLINLQRLPTSEFQAQVAGQIGQTYQIETSSDLRQWTPLSAHILTDRGVTFTDRDAAQSKHRFYRVVPSP